MTVRRTREITIQTTDTLSIRLDEVCTETTCAECGSGVPMLTPEAVAAAFVISLRGIYRQVEAGRVHFRVTNAGRLLVCPNSLQSLVQSGSGELRQDPKTEER